MALETPATSSRQVAATVEPSRAWILGLVVESDGSVSGPASERTLEWPSCECSGDCGTDHEAAHLGLEYVEDLPESKVV